MALFALTYRIVASSSSSDTGSVISQVQESSLAEVSAFSITIGIPSALSLSSTTTSSPTPTTRSQTTITPLTTVTSTSTPAAASSPLGQVAGAAADLRVGLVKFALSLFLGSVAGAWVVGL